ncbi:hypothetical protein KIN20_032084 [Parelaphostrongylus tenuis]|uniref:Uncharacterized protein n=1 Tax=Parelaphostrongylus tenuis TaxID=148309 RepID=A0AAD5R649_PARTN|nr:hypothetical protein KIN20_032084 [Parelaphostrongylus tenuis]
MQLSQTMLDEFKSVGCISSGVDQHRKRYPSPFTYRFPPNQQCIVFASLFLDDISIFLYDLAVLLVMVLEAFPWDASTSVASLTDSQIQQLCSLIRNKTITSLGDLASSSAEEESMSSLLLPERPKTYWVVF